MEETGQRGQSICEFTVGGIPAETKGGTLHLEFETAMVVQTVAGAHAGIQWDFECVESVFNLSGECGGEVVLMPDGDGKIRHVMGVKNHPLIVVFESGEDVEAATVFALGETLAVNEKCGMGNGRRCHADECEATRQWCNWKGVSEGMGNREVDFWEGRVGTFGGGWRTSLPT